jgi:hypothetical protein
VITWAGIRSARRTRAIYDAPLRTLVEVTTISRMYYHRRAFVDVVEYEYRDDAGRYYYGLGQEMSEDEASRWHPGDVASIIVNRNQPEVSLLGARVRRVPRVAA